MTSWATGEELTQTEESEYRRLCGKHRDIRTDGAQVLARNLEKQELQIRRQQFVNQHQLECFRCGATTASWVAGGKNAWGQLWVICSSCVRKPK